MGYSEDAKSTKKHLRKLHFAKKYRFRPVRSNDWTSAFLSSANLQMGKHGLVVRNSQFDYFICKKERSADLVKLFEKLELYFESPTP